MEYNDLWLDAILAVLAADFIPHSYAQGESLRQICGLLSKTDIVLPNKVIIAADKAICFGSTATAAYDIKVEVARAGRIVIRLWGEGKFESAFSEKVSFDDIGRLPFALAMALREAAYLTDPSKFGWPRVTVKE